jgi:DNA mismatch repair protein PMS2
MTANKPVEVRFKNNGLDAIEVQDNGAGISPEDYETIALKHYTSKLSTYDDLSSLQTFGFRGEALSSLCALSKFHIVTARASDGAKGTKLEFEQSGKLKGTSVAAAKQGTTVVVESLFHNLPVRRKQLEKTVKREYGHVINLLHAYACISTGVKFSVSNQIPKGKKTIAFATNANPSTKENIANVYGAKALSSLIPLDLKFEMDPSNRPGATQSARNRSTQEDPASRTVRVIGHMSRPVVGEGRQTPDRQMFYVNSRPCGLPQLAKVFNEVYKSYNFTQSPFVFADIKLDTDAYDVNVSPDKRTIMLHDQTALLESLREALVDLFQTHDQSVPQAQSLDKRTPSLPTFRPPVIEPRQRMDSADGEKREPARLPEPRKLSSTLVQDSSSSFSSEVAPLPGFTKASLIERFAGKDAEDRSAPPRPRKRRSMSPEPARDAEETVVRREPRQASPSPEPATSAADPVARPPSPLFEPEEAVAVESPLVVQPSKVVQDFNARMASQGTRPGERVRSSRSSSPSEAEGEDEQAIPVVKQTTKKQLSQSTLQNAFDRTRPTRTPLQQATITIGDTTTVSTVGSGSQTLSAKRSRIHTPRFGLNGIPLTQTPKKRLFMKSLRGFAAPGTQFEESEDEGEEAAQESSMSEVRARSPSSHKRPGTKEFEEPRTDKIDISSGAPLPPEPRLDGNVEEVDEESALELPVEKDASDDEYIDESEKKAREDAKVAKMIAQAEEAAARPTEMNLKRAGKLFKVSHKKFMTLNLERHIDTDIESIATHLDNLTSALENAEAAIGAVNSPSSTELNKEDPEERLSLTVTKQDFRNMRIIGQFNLGFILAVRPPTPTSPTPDLFIIDQHASDEKYNFEDLSATTMLVSQRLVHPHPLELTAVEEEIILENQHSLTANGFVVDMDTSGSTTVGHRAKLTSLPMSKEVTFTPTDLEELIALLIDHPPSTSSSTSLHLTRPTKVRKLLASRACRKSVMVGKTLKAAQMEGIVRHMGSMDKPWSCPHGRPTMRHLYGLDRWEGWKEGDGMKGLGEVGMRVDWGDYARRMRA